MDISKGSIYELLNGKYQFVVPVYQRKVSIRRNAPFTL